MCSSFQKALSSKHPKNKGKSGSSFSPRKVRHIQLPVGSSGIYISSQILSLFSLLAFSSRFLLPHPLVALSLLHPVPLPQLPFLLLPSTLHTSTCCTTPVSFSFSAGHSYTYRLVWDDPASSTIPYCGQNRAVIAPEAPNQTQRALVSTRRRTRNEQSMWQLWEHAVSLLFSVVLQSKVSIKGYESREAAKLGLIT